MSRGGGCKRVQEDSVGRVAAKAKKQFTVLTENVVFGVEEVLF